MKKRTFIPIALFVFILSSCLNVSYLTDEKIEQSYKTYYLESGRNSLVIDSVSKNIIYSHEVLIEVLNSKGLSKVDNKETADVIIHANIIVIEKKGYYEYYDHYYSEFDSQGYDASYTTDYLYKEGSLSIDFFDNKTEKLVWQGVAETEMSDGNKLTKKQIKKIISKTLNNF